MPGAQQSLSELGADPAGCADDGNWHDSLRLLMVFVIVPPHSGFSVTSVPTGADEVCK